MIDSDTGCWNGRIRWPFFIKGYNDNKKVSYVHDINK